jgi:hypothetical protein
MLEHIAESWSDIAAELTKTGSMEPSRSAERPTPVESARR